MLSNFSDCDNLTVEQSMQCFCPCLSFSPSILIEYMWVRLFGVPETASDVPSPTFARILFIFNSLAILVRIICFTWMNRFTAQASAPWAFERVLYGEIYLVFHPTTPLKHAFIFCFLSCLSVTSFRYKVIILLMLPVSAFEDCRYMTPWRMHRPSLTGDKVLNFCC